MGKVTLPWGPDETIDFELPDGWNLKDVLGPKMPKNLPDVKEEIDRAMDNTVGLPGLAKFAKGKNSAAIVIDDRTRPTPVDVIMSRVVKELNDAGIKDENICVVTALGTHRDMTDEEIAERIGDEMFTRIKCYNHHFENQAELVSVGITPKYKLPVKFNKYVVEADVVVSIGCIEAHEQAGVGGGYKNIMPGVCDAPPIYKTHNAKFQKPPRISLAGMPREQCRFRQALEECGELLGPKVFIINTVTAGNTVLSVCAGHPIKAHAAGREVYEKMAKIELPNGPADIVIAAARPLDIDLRVTMKSCFNAAPALKPGGIFISVSATTEKMGDLRLPDNLPKIAGALIRKMPVFMNDLIAGKINPSPDQAAGTVSLIKMLKSFQAIYIMTSMDEHKGAYESMGVHCYTDMEKLLASAAKLKPKGDVTVLTHAGASFISWD